jgi:hypothetical protein
MSALEALIEVLEDYPQPYTTLTVNTLLQIVKEAQDKLDIGLEMSF